MNDSKVDGAGGTPAKSDAKGFWAFVKGAFGLGPAPVVREWKLLVSLALFLILAHNTVFFSKLRAVYPLGREYLFFNFSVFAVLVALTTLLLTLVSSRVTTKIVATVILVASSLVSYFTNTFGVVVDVDMLRNALETNRAEAFDLASPGLFIRVLFLGVLPSVIVWRLRIERLSFWRAVRSRLILGATCVGVIAVLMVSSASTVASFLRTKKSLRPYINPIGYIYAVGKLASKSGKTGPITISPIAEDARRQSPGKLPRLVILVVGETARADHFSLNGYERETNPRLRKEDVVNFPNVMSDGTSTAISVPSMFSHFGRKGFDTDAARRTENVLDVLARTGVSVLWRENNSDSKGVALRVRNENFKDPARNPVNDGEPRDEGMLLDLQDYIDSQSGDTLVVLHTMGSHGPAYYKRYPKEFEVFTPVCQSSQLEKCTSQEIINAYDNTILYTDYVLAKTIELLKRNDDRRETAMLYFSDHGESLGENNLYLHGYPYALAPMAQKHIPAVFWFGSAFPVNREKMRRSADAPYSHDNLFHTLLGLFGVETKYYKAPLDMVGPHLTPGPTGIASSSNP